MKMLYDVVDDYPKYFGMDLLMKLLNRSDSAVRRAIKKRYIKSTKLRKIYYFKREDIKSYLGECFK